MLPELFRIPGLNMPVHTYGLMVVAGFVAALFIAARQARRYGRYENDVWDYGFWALIGGMLGARIVFIMVEWRDYVKNAWTTLPILNIPFPRVLALWEGGIVFWGSMLGGFLAYVIFARSRKLPMLMVADFLVVGVPLAQVFGRLGCVAAGCCYGGSAYHLDAAGKVVANMPFALRFPPSAQAYSSLFAQADSQTKDLMLQLGTTVPLFPSQYAEAFGTAIIFFVLLAMSPRKFFHGQLLFAYAILYSILRAVLEIFRGDAARGYVIDGVLSTSQFISVAVIATSIVAFVILKKRGEIKIEVSST